MFFFSSRYFFFIPNLRIIEFLLITRRIAEGHGRQKFDNSIIRDNDKSRKFVTIEKSWDRKGSSVILRDLPCEDYNSQIRKFVTSVVKVS